MTLETRDTPVVLPAEGRFTGKVALVTGAAGGIGRAVARQLHSEGASVVAVDLAKEVANTAAQMGDMCLPVQADVSNETDVRRMIDTAEAEFGRLDVVCNNAAIDGQPALLADCPEQEYERVLAVNARSVFLSMSFAIPKLIAAGGGAIVNIASIAANVAWPTLSPYSASKAAVVMLTKVAAAEYGKDRVRVNCICPGAIDTPMLRRAGAEKLDAVVAMTPLGRIGDPHELARTVSFLASEEGSFITGQSISVDGGFTVL